MNISQTLKNLNVDINEFSGEELRVFSPIDGSEIAHLKVDHENGVKEKIESSHKAFEYIRDIPAPKRGELIRVFGDELRRNKEELAKLVTIECGKILEEGRGEVQEMIDICDFAVGLSRKVGGLTLPSERSKHAMHENWLPLGVVGVISAFNFPVAVWAWNFALAVVCGNSVIWKPSEKTPLTAIACNKIFQTALKKFNDASGLNISEDISQLIIGDYRVGDVIANNRKVALVSATGSSKMGKIVGENVASRFGKCLLELGGNNALIVTESADLNLALPAILFGAVGTAGQRCTSTRRLIVHENIFNEMHMRLKTAYEGLESKVGNPLDDNVLIGPLIDEIGYKNMEFALAEARNAGGEVTGGERVLENKRSEAFYVKPALIKMTEQNEIVMSETFAPILYMLPFKNLEEALEINNAVPQGLSSSIFTTDLREAEYFKQYSDCGIANVNIGTSGAEIGGAFGGEKETGGGRESGSDAWKNYMRRQTSTTYYGIEKPELAQGIKFD